MCRSLRPSILYGETHSRLPYSAISCKGNTCRITELILGLRVDRINRIVLICLIFIVIEVEVVVIILAMKGYDRDRGNFRQIPQHKSRLGYPSFRSKSRGYNNSRGSYRRPDSYKDRGDSREPKFHGQSRSPIRPS